MRMRPLSDDFIQHYLDVVGEVREVALDFVAAQRTAEPAHLRADIVHGPLQHIAVHHQRFQPDERIIEAAAGEPRPDSRLA